MLDEYEHQLDYIHVIESLPLGDLKTGQQLYDAVITPMAFELPHLDAKLSVLCSRTEFWDALARTTALARDADRSPVLHLEVHGNTQGFTLASGDRITWDELRSHLTDLNIACDFGLLVITAACSGAHLVKVLHPLHRAPVWGLIGPQARVCAGDLQERFQAFYETLFRTVNAQAAMEALNNAKVGDPWRYAFYSAMRIFRLIWRKYFREFGSHEALLARQEEITAMVMETGPPRPGMTEQDVRDIIRKGLHHHDEYVRQSITTYFMYDILPGNRDRFQISVDELRRGI